MSEFLHDAEQRTESWQRRHSPEAIAQLGVWRWKGIQKHAARILDAICGKRVIDFGGADGPLGFGSIVVDSKSEAKTLDDIAGQVDVIFTSHTLEHVEDVEGFLTESFHKLLNGGVLIAHVPAWTCERWRADRYNNSAQPNGHKHTFDIPGLAERFSLSGFDMELAEYCGDDSIIIFARKLCE